MVPKHPHFCGGCQGKQYEHLGRMMKNGWPSGVGDGKVNGLGVEYQLKYLRMETENEHKDTEICKCGVIIGFITTLTLSTLMHWMKR